MVSRAVAIPLLQLVASALLMKVTVRGWFQAVPAQPCGQAHDEEEQPGLPARLQKHFAAALVALGTSKSKEQISPGIVSCASLRTNAVLVVVNVVEVADLVIEVMEDVGVAVSVVMVDVMVSVAVKVAI